MKAGKKSADAVVAEKRGNARGEGRKKPDRAREGTEGKLRRDLKSKGRAPTGRLPESATGRSGGTAASLASAIPRRNFAELPTESDVRD